MPCIVLHRFVRTVMLTNACHNLRKILEQYNLINQELCSQVLDLQERLKGDLGCMSPVASTPTNSDCIIDYYSLDAA